MRRLIALAGAAVAVACASMGAPPGGPTRTEPPALVRVTPDSGSVNVTEDDVVFEFDAVVNDQARGGTLDRLVLVSPDGEDARVRWRRERISVRPRDGFRPNTAYRVTLLPGISDLNNNATVERISLVFSTGDSIPPWSVHGRVFEWLAERVARNAVVELVRITDSLPYLGLADSAGQFAVGPVERGGYRVMAYLDNNQNRMRDPGEPWDSLSALVLDESPFVELLTTLRDTTPPALLTVTAVDSATIRAAFDRPLNPSFALVPAAFRVQRADSSDMAVLRVLTAAQYAAIRAAADSQARDSTTRAAQPAPPPGAPQVPRPSRRPPPTEVVLLLDSLAPLRPGEAHRVTVVAARGLLGGTRTSGHAFTAPRPDTAAAAPTRRP